jgi:hypothetical protein
VSPLPRMTFRATPCFLLIIVLMHLGVLSFWADEGPARRASTALSSPLRGLDSHCWCVSARTRFRGVSPRTACALAGIGAVQFGVMYLALNEKLPLPPGLRGRLLFTLTTPVIVTAVC